MKLIKEYVHAVERKVDRFRLGGGVGVLESIVDAGPRRKLTNTGDSVTNLGDRTVEVILAGWRRNLAEQRQRLANQRVLAIIIGETQVFGFASPCTYVADKTLSTIKIGQTLHTSTGCITPHADAAIFLFGLYRTLILTG